MEKEAGRFKNYGKTLVKRLSARFTFSLILFGVFGFGAVFNRWLLSRGFSSMVVRSAVTFPLSYFFFFVLVWTWLAYLQPRFIRRRDQVGSLETSAGLMAGSQAQTQSKTQPKFQSQSQSQSQSPSRSSFALSRTRHESDSRGVLSFVGNMFELVFEGIGAILRSELGAGILILLLLFGVLVILYFAASWLISEGAMMLVDTALDAALAASLMRRTPTAEGSDWTYGLLRRTWLSFVLFWVLALGISYMATDYCPGARRLSDAYRCVTNR